MFDCRAVPCCPQGTPKTTTQDTGAYDLGYADKNTYDLGSTTNGYVAQGTDWCVW